MSHTGELESSPFYDPRTACSLQLILWVPWVSVCSSVENGCLLEGALLSVAMAEEIATVDTDMDLDIRSRRSLINLHSLAPTA